MWMTPPTIAIYTLTISDFHDRRRRGSPHGQVSPIYGATLSMPTFSDRAVTAPWLDALLWATLAVAILWLLVGAWTAWRRKALNLTVVDSAQGDVTPGFMTLDQGKRQQALDRAGRFEGELNRQDAQKAAVKGAKTDLGLARTTRVLAVFMSFFSLATLIAGAVWQVGWLGVVWEKWSAGGRIAETLRAHPVAAAVCLAVIAFHVLTFVRERRWAGA